MATNKLNDNKLKALLKNLPEKETWIADGEGLALRMQRGGNLSWYFRYRLGGRNSKLERLFIGKYPDLPLAAARKLKDKCRNWLADNKDPRFMLDRITQEALKPVTVKDALEYWLNNYAVHNRKNHEKHRSQLIAHIYPKIGAMPLSMAERRHWLDALENISRKGSPVAAGYVLQMCKQALRYCDRRGYATSTALERLTIPDVGKKQEKDDRVLTDSELSDLLKWLNTNRIQPYYRDLIKLMLVFCARTKEVRLSTWDEWDFDAKLWTVPKDNSKNGIRITRPIPDRVIPWLVDMRQHNNGPFILGEFKEGTTVSQYGRILYKRLKHKEPWTLHNLRHTFITKNADLGAAPHVVELLAGHELGGVFSIYNRGEYLSEKLQVLNCYLDRLELLAEPQKNVIAATFIRAL
ncbi:MAG: site-specific integrase [Gammaproteobacteria bacterium]|nr:site-specific integrase [Gammaproteobacteria bacterium]